ncbi:zf-HC2 domain-containing protein [Streptomyces sp. LHD-70]|uniref:zf-HC2 domain-containing protein n=1 Tax=Streptomyces sp. LHD-70 TaxID=3072140 RepID=UPI0035BE18BC
MNADPSEPDDGPEGHDGPDRHGESDPRHGRADDDIATGGALAEGVPGPDGRPRENGRPGPGEHPGARPPHGGGLRIPPPRSSIEDSGRPLPEPPPLPAVPAPAPPVLEHKVLKSLLGAWALAACSAEEAAAVELHLGGCGACADEALRLRDAVGLLHPEESLDLDPGLRSRVLAGCLDRRPPRIPVPDWAAPYDAETARLDALLQDFGNGEWHAPVQLKWYEGDEAVTRRTTVAGVIAHLLTVDGLVATTLGLDDPLPEAARAALTGTSPAERTEAYWNASRFPATRGVRLPWREQSHTVIRTVSFAGGGSAELAVPYGEFTLPLRDSMLDRAFECWVHAGDIADAVDYPYQPPAPRHLNRMIDLAARMLPGALADRRRAGLAAPAKELVAAGAPGRSLRLEVEGHGGGEWLIPLDSPGAAASQECEVAHVALDGVEFCRLAAGHVPPEDAAAGQVGDREAIRDVLSAAAALSRM